MKVSLTSPLFAAIIERLPGQTLAVIYTNYRGETAHRSIVPMEIRHGSSEWHPEPQYLLKALDVEEQAVREFALADMVLA